MPLPAESLEGASPGEMGDWKDGRLGNTRWATVGPDGSLLTWRAAVPCSRGSNKDPKLGAYFLPQQSSLSVARLRETAALQRRSIWPASEAIAGRIPGGRQSRRNGRLEGWKIGQNEWATVGPDGSLLTWRAAVPCSRGS